MGEYRGKKITGPRWENGSPGCTGQGPGIVGAGLWMWGSYRLDGHGSSRGAGAGGPHPEKAVVGQAFGNVMPAELAVQDHVFHLVDLDLALWRWGLLWDAPLSSLALPQPASTRWTPPFLGAGSSLRPLQIRPLLSLRPSWRQALLLGTALTPAIPGLPTRVNLLLAVTAPDQRLQHHT